jgi:hypothetical protein
MVPTTARVSLTATWPLLARRSYIGRNKTRGSFLFAGRQKVLVAFYFRYSCNGGSLL